MTAQRIVELHDNIADPIALAADLRAIDEKLAQLKSRRQAVVTELEPLLGTLPKEGTSHVVVGKHRLTIKTRMNRRIDQMKAARAVEALRPDIAARALPVTHKLSIRELRYLKLNDRKSYAVVRKVFTETAAPLTITVEQTGE